MQNSIKRIRDIIVCPYCHGPLKESESKFECLDCIKEFPVDKGVPNFSYLKEIKTPDARFQADRMFQQTLTAKIHNWGKRFVNSEYMPRDHIIEFLSTASVGSIILELGSGNRRLRNDIINIDLFNFPNVDLISDIVKTPFADSSVDYVVLDTVLEHVPEPHKVVEEVYRIMKPSGRVVCIVPWVFPYHGYPKNYFNISEDGLAFLFRNFGNCSIEMNIGPTSALTNLISEYFALAFSRKRKIFYSFFKGLFLLPIFLFKFLDKFWFHSEKSKRIAALLCLTATR